MPVTFTTDNPPPTDIDITRSGTTYTITWVDNSDNETEQRIERSTDDGATWNTVTSVGINITSVTFTVSQVYPGELWRVVSVTPHTTSVSAVITVAAASLLANAAVNMADTGQVSPRLDVDPGATLSLSPTAPVSSALTIAPQSTTAADGTSQPTEICRITGTTLLAANSTTDSTEAAAMNVARTPSLLETNGVGIGSAVLDLIPVVSVLEMADGAQAEAILMSTGGVVFEVTVSDVDTADNARLTATTEQSVDDVSVAVGAVTTVSLTDIVSTLAASSRVTGVMTVDTVTALSLGGTVQPTETVSQTVSTPPNLTEQGVSSDVAAQRITTSMPVTDVGRPDIVPSPATFSDSVSGADTGRVVTQPVVEPETVVSGDAATSTDTELSRVRTGARVTVRDGGVVAPLLSVSTTATVGPGPLSTVTSLRERLSMYGFTLFDSAEAAATAVNTEVARIDGQTVVTPSSVAAERGRVVATAVTNAVDQTDLLRTIKVDAPHRPLRYTKRDDVTYDGDGELRYAKRDDVTYSDDGDVIYD